MHSGHSRLPMEKRNHFPAFRVTLEDDPHLLQKESRLRHPFSCQHAACLAPGLALCRERDFTDKEARAQPKQIHVMFPMNVAFKCAALGEGESKLLEQENAG